MELARARTQHTHTHIPSYFSATTSSTLLVFPWPEREDTVDLCMAQEASAIAGELLNKGHGAVARTALLTGETEKNVTNLVPTDLYMKPF